ncbi:MAG: type II toxin-antitoxin system HicA family toxin [Ignavibacteriaceae bacterium]|nr:type II toxin-antitoxin system HicA family toxin [Ignavibacteriaceae bacterium]
MRIPRNLSASELIKELIRFGYTTSRQKGSHIRLTYSKDELTHHITIPNHDPLKIGTLNNILNDLVGVHKIEKTQLTEVFFGKNK